MFQRFGEYLVSEFGDPFPSFRTVKGVSCPFMVNVDTFSIYFFTRWLWFVSRVRRSPLCPPRGLVSVCVLSKTDGLSPCRCYFFEGCRKGVPDPWVPEGFRLRLVVSCRGMCCVRTPSYCCSSSDRDPADVLTSLPWWYTEVTCPCWLSTPISWLWFFWEVD